MELNLCCFTPTLLDDGRTALMLPAGREESICSWGHESAARHGRRGSGFGISVFPGGCEPGIYTWTALGHSLWVKNGIG